MQKIKFIACAFGFLSLCSLLLGEENGFRDSLFDYIEIYSQKTPPIVLENEKIYDSQKSHSIRYEKGDWVKYIVSKQYPISFETAKKKLLSVDTGEDSNITSYGSLKMNLVYGKSYFTRGKYKRYDEDKPVSKIIQSGFYPEKELQLHLEGTVGKRIKLYVDHDSNRADNRYVMKYTAEEEDETIREINAGEVDIKLNNSKWIVFDDATRKGLGVDMTVKKNRLRMKAFGSINKGEVVVERFRGNAMAKTTELQEYQYVRGKYYQLEPFKRYDNLSSKPSGASAYGLVTFTSMPADPKNYVLHSVNIDPSSFELYMDDQNPHNNYNTITLPIDGGKYMKLSSGIHYTINFSSGLITLINPIPENARIFAVYTLNGGSTVSSDPSARTDVFVGKIFVFIKYGASMDEDVNKNFELDADEDKNGDGMLNLDIYEVRSIYYIGDRNILDNNFYIDFFHEQSQLSRAEIEKTGRYIVNPSEGTIVFYLRQPFQSLLKEDAHYIYRENQGQSALQHSRYKLRINYFKEARSFQLSHTNVLTGSVRVRINGREISPSLYTVDYTMGFLEFIDPNNPLIGPESDIEIRYEYLPVGGGMQSIFAGLRADYDLSRNLDIGGTVLFSRGAGSGTIPKIGGEPQQLLVFESDAKLRISEKQLEEFINSLPCVSIKSFPFEINVYAEYAKSYKNVNTFGKALIDDMESGDEIVAISLSERDWILSSPPSHFASNAFPQLTQANRGLLRYLYYRSLESSDTLRTPSFTPYAIDYAVKPGPYNVATGHLASNIAEEQHQRSLALYFDFSGGKNYVSVVTRRLSNQPVDFSSLQYVEVWYRSTGGSGTVALYFDIGRINEDSDGDNVLDTEDMNNNGFLDFDPSANIFEDDGYIFNPAGGIATRVGSGPRLSSFTAGDGTLTSEDLNGNGMLDTNERIIRMPGDITTPYGAAAPLVVDLADTSWHRARIYIDRSAPSYVSNSHLYDDILSVVEAVRIFVVSQTALSGTIYIDKISFVCSRWQNIKINGISAENPAKISISIVDTHNDPEYRADAFIYKQSDVYKALHGEKNTKELEKEKETALSIKYDLSGGYASFTRKFQTPIDLRFYSTCNFWINFREFSHGDALTIALGSSERDRIEYDVLADHPGMWKELSLRLNASSRGTVQISKTLGNPDLKRIRYIEITIRGMAGRFWLNDIYASDPETLGDSAWWIEGELRSKKPLARTASGIPIISDIVIKYIVKGHGAQFESVGTTTKDMREQYYQLFSSATLLPGWVAQFDYQIEKSVTDSFNETVIDTKRGDAGKKSLFIETAYINDLPFIPNIKLSYKHDRNNNMCKEFVSGMAIDKKFESLSRSPMLWLEEKIKNILGGSITATFQIQSSFNEELITRTSDQISLEDLIIYKSPKEKEYRQKSLLKCNLDYQTARFYFSPTVEMGSHEIVRLEGKTDLTDTKILTDVRGGFHIPFVCDDEYRFVDRNKSLVLKTGLKDFLFLEPNLTITMHYLENRFRDYTEVEKKDSFSFTRAKDAQSYIASRIDIPLVPLRTERLEFLKSITVGFGRTLYLQETEVPYEGEGIPPYDERFGIRRSYGALAGASFNIFKYNQIKFLQGRDNFAGERDYVFSTLNEPIAFDDGKVVPGYNNSLKCVDSISLSSLTNFGMMDVTLVLGINNLSERKQILSPPQQIVSYSAQVGVNVDLMRIFSFGFFRPNKPGIPHHAAHVTSNYTYSRNMIITSNIQEDVHSPILGLNFKRDRTGVGLKGGIDFRLRKDVEYIPTRFEERDRRDDVYAENLVSTEHFKEDDKSYKFSVFFETDVNWLYNAFASIYELKARPIFNIEYSLLWNRYDYTLTVSPEPYDQHLCTTKLVLDLHQNIQGGILGRWAFEKFRNRDTNGVYREIISYELGLNFTMLF